MNNSKYSSAPYHFIDLNKNVLQSDNQSNHYSIYKSDLNTGHFEVEIEAITELFTRGKNQYFKTVNGKPVFVGSSIRGPIRVIAEQMGYAEMQDVDKEEAFFFRSFGMREYRDIMKPDQIKGGWLVRENDNFKLYAAEKFNKSLVDSSIPASKPTQDRSVLFVTNDDLNTQLLKDRGVVRFKNFKPYREARRNEPYSDNYCIIMDPVSAKNTATGVLMVSGEMKGKAKEAIIGVKSNQCVLEGSKLLAVLSKIENDKNRPSQFSRTDIKKEPIPCFYIGDRENAVTAIGFNYFFRYPYAKSVGNCINQSTAKVENTKALDFATTIFGDENPENNSKVFFEDFYLRGDPNAQTEKYPHILAEPKASYYPHYVEQNDEGKPKTWGNAASIAGYKNYYHRTEQDVWIRKEFKIGEKIKPNDSLFEKHLTEFKRHEYVHLLTEFRLNSDQDKSETEAYIAKEKLEYKKSKPENRATKYYLQLRTAAHYQFFAAYQRIQYTLFYVNPPIHVLEKLPEFRYQTDEEKESSKSKVTLDSKPIRVIPRKSIFKGRIRFENLSDAELGLLLLSLDLPEGHAHKIGMGKPIGLGSARFKTTLFLTDRNTRYASVFTQTSWNLGITEISEENKSSGDRTKEHFINAFKTHFKAEMQTEWDSLPRIKNLYYLLKTTGTETKAWTEKTRYLEMDGRNGNEFNIKDSDNNKRILRPLYDLPSPKPTVEMPEVEKPKKEPRIKRNPDTVPEYDFEALKMNDELVGILTQAKEVKIKLKQGEQYVQLVIKKGEPMHDFEVGEVVDITIKQLAPKSQKISQVSLKK